MPILKSSYLQSADYNDKHLQLDVTFMDGSRWRYWGVTKPTWDAFQSAASKGAFFREVIRNHHKATKL